MRYTLSLVIFLAAIWLLNSGHYGPLLLFFGAISIALVVWIAQKMRVVDQEAQPLSISLGLPFYWLWLAKEIVLSNIDVVKHVWFQPHAIDPAVKRLSISQTTEMGRVIYANSITLTPGTVTLELEDDSVTVHALKASSLVSLEKGEMDRRVTSLEKMGDN